MDANNAASVPLSIQPGTHLHQSTPYGPQRSKRSRSPPVQEEQAKRSKPPPLLDNTSSCQGSICWARARTPANGTTPGFRTPTMDHSSRPASGQQALVCGPMDGMHTNGCRVGIGHCRNLDSAVQATSERIGCWSSSEERFHLAGLPAPPSSPVLPGPVPFVRSTNMLLTAEPIQASSGTPRRRRSESFYTTPPPALGSGLDTSHWGVPVAAGAIARGGTGVNPNGDTVVSSAAERDIAALRARLMSLPLAAACHQLSTDVIGLPSLPIPRLPCTELIPCLREP
ncbi:hypothetical protein CCHR01_18477 [Colletotrichum chrysophilum]|uniref:Uncharacterized protein n=1 Tax=Colletotrichum chrysophilum TaxID=1836956 RepID=A0AAD9A4H9_9PEZI|nr:hypothetical protein CCHR01_18477 [Colletotrichum chrysophilum]